MIRNGKIKFVLCSLLCCSILWASSFVLINQFCQQEQRNTHLEDNEIFEYIDPRIPIDGYYSIPSQTNANKSYRDLYIRKFNEETGLWSRGGWYHSTFVSKLEMELYIKEFFIVKYPNV